MIMNRLKSGRGGARKGAGRKSLGVRVAITVRISQPAKMWLDAQNESQSAIIDALLSYADARGFSFKR